MSLMVTRFSQDASLDNPKDTKNFLILRNEAGIELRVEVSQEDMQKVIGTVFASKALGEVNNELQDAQLPDEPETFTDLEEEATNVLAQDEDGIESL